MGNSSHYDLPVRCLLVKSGQANQWYIHLKLEDAADIIPQLNRLYGARFFAKEEANPHMAIQVRKGEYPSALQLATSWHASISKGLVKYREILINSMGGWMPMSDGIEILETREKSKWPIPHEEVSYTISRWGDGVHYYVGSDASPIDSYKSFRQKFNTMQEAEDHIKNISPTAKIRVDEKYHYSKEGD